LIVAPVNTLANWEEEIKRFTPRLSVLVHHGPGRRKDTEVFSEYDLILISYHTVRNDVALFTSHEFTYVVLDESQTINPSSQLFKCARMLRADHRLSLTGTPVENHTTELWAQMSFLNPGLLGTFASFKRRFVRAIEEKENPEKIEELSRVVFPFILRRKKVDVLKELPAKEEIIMYAEMEARQRSAYNEIKARYQQRVLEHIENEGISRSGIIIIEALTKLRQAAILPEMVSHTYAGIPSCKFDLFFSVIEDIIEEGYKVIVFSQFLHSLDVMRRWFTKHNIEFSYIDGSTTNRATEIQRFQEDPLRKAFLISLKAGGVGINLTKADYVFLFDPWWNPAVEQQAIDRAHRIGRKNKVIAYKIITRNSVEEKILTLQDKKKKLADGLISSEQTFFKALNREDIQEIFA
jgi:SNF2 family DNA or RNA helicase